MTTFYKKDTTQGVNQLSEEESKHCSQVLRHKIGDEIIVFDGKGGKHRSKLTLVSKKVCEFEIIESTVSTRKSFYIHLAIAPTKNTDRLEWMIEKICEIGVDEVTFIETNHSERRKLRIDRLEKKAISAMKQSGNQWLLQINELTGIREFIQASETDQHFIAHVSTQHPYLYTVAQPNKSSTVLIGPEGDFSEDEMKYAIENGFKPVSLGQNTLRTETAGLIACSMINFLNNA